METLSKCLLYRLKTIPTEKKKENKSHKVSEAGNWEKKKQQKEPQYRKRTSN